MLASLILLCAELSSSLFNFAFFFIKFLSARHLPAFINQITKTQRDTVSLLKFSSRSTKTSNLKRYNFGAKNYCVADMY